MFLLLVQIQAMTISTSGLRRMRKGLFMAAVLIGGYSLKTKFIVSQCLHYWGTVRHL